MKNIKKSIIFSIALFLPALVFAQGTGTLQSLIAVIGNIVNRLVVIGGGVAVVAFFYGIAIFVLNAGDEKKVEEGKSWMFWSVIALFVMITIWGIIGLLQNTLGNRGHGKVDIVVPRF
jgi:hypothetical protein